MSKEDMGEKIVDNFVGSLKNGVTEEELEEVCKNGYSALENITKEIDMVIRGLQEIDAATIIVDMLGSAQRGASQSVSEEQYLKIAKESLFIAKQYAERTLHLLNYEQENIENLLGSLDDRVNIKINMASN